MAREIDSAEDLLAEIYEQASRLPTDEIDPNSLSSPVDQVDVWIDVNAPPEPEDKPLQENKDDWLPEHDYYLGDDGQPDVDDGEDAKETLRFFIEDEGHLPSAPDFEFQFRAFLHNNDYSYSATTVVRVLSTVRPSAKATLSFLK